MKKVVLRICAFGCLSLVLVGAVSAKKLREKFSDCFLTGIDENGVESNDLGANGTGRATEKVEEGEISMKCRGTVPNLSGEKYEATGDPCRVIFISDGTAAQTDDVVYTVSKKGKAKLICHATRDDVVP